MSFTFIDLFAGVGGMRIGFERAGGQCVLTCEIDPHAAKTYYANFEAPRKHVHHGDILTLSSGSVPKHDILVAGFPCQPYSIAGLRRGLEDQRGAVFMEVVRILREVKPRALLLENVKGILAHDRGATFAYLRTLLEDAGYTTVAQTLNSMTHANVPQNRERVFIAGFRDSRMAGKFEFPEPVRLTRSVAGCLERGKVDRRYYYDERFGCFGEIQNMVTDPGTVYQWRRQYVRENKSRVCPTLTANMGAGGHNVPLVRVADGIRKLTPRECANFQGFPRDFALPDIADSHLYHQMGNSVTVPLIERLANEFARVLQK